jgi:hypothetical protein
MMQRRITTMILLTPECIQKFKYCITSSMMMLMMMTKIIITVSSSCRQWWSYRFIRGDGWTRNPSTNSKYLPAKFKMLDLIICQIRLLMPIPIPILLIVHAPVSRQPLIIMLLRLD